MEFKKNTQNSQPLVSWLMCTHIFNSQVREAIQSCLDQDFSDFELVIVTNGPRSNLICGEIRDTFNDARIRILATEICHLTFSLNLGLNFARGSLIARMDSDDRSMPNRLSSQVAFLQEHPEIDVLGTDYEIINAKGDKCGQHKAVRSNLGIRRKLLFGNPLAHPTVMFRKTLVVQAGGYSGYHLAEDYDLWMRLSNNSDCRFENLPLVCLQYRSISIGGGRGTKSSYSSVVASQIRNFLMGKGTKWLFASLITLSKIFLKTIRTRSDNSCQH